MSQPNQTATAAYLRVSEEGQLSVSVWRNGSREYEARHPNQFPYPAEPTMVREATTWGNTVLRQAGYEGDGQWTTPWKDNPDPTLDLHQSIAPSAEHLEALAALDQTIAPPFLDPPSPEEMQENLAAVSAEDRELIEKINRTRPDRPIWLAGENQAGSLTNDPTSVTAHATPDEARLAVADQIKDFAEHLSQTDEDYLAGRDESLTASADAWGDVVKHDIDGDFRDAKDGEFVVTLNDTTYSAQEFWVHKSTIAEHFGPDWQDDDDAVEFIHDAPVEPAVYVTGTKGIEAGDEYHTESGWVNPRWSRTDLFDSRYEVAPLYIGDDPQAAAEAIEEFIGSVEEPEAGRGTFYGSDGYEDLQTGDRVVYAAHADGYSPAQIKDIERRLDPKVAAATPLTEAQLASLREQAADKGLFHDNPGAGTPDSRDAIQARLAALKNPKAATAGRKP